MLGRGDNEQHVRAWLAVAAVVPGLIGFAVGRTTFPHPLIALRDQGFACETAVAGVARRHRQWVDFLERAEAAAPSSDATLAPGLVGTPQG